MALPVTPGISTFLSGAGFYKQLRLALVTNDAARTITGELSRAALLKNGFTLAKIFSPEHGITTKGEDGVLQKNKPDDETGLPVISLYSEKMAPGEEDLQDTDAVLFDIPDAGCRFYTYLWTMTHVLESCATFNKPLIILDRPNPVGGDLKMAEGPMLDELNCSSFTGRWSIPVRHCCTLGELALYFNREKNTGAEVNVFPAKNWQRHQLAGSPGFPFYPTSPAIKNIETALLYPGMGLLEGVNVNEGRGTEKPFLQFGAPWLNAPAFHDALLQKVTTGIKTKIVSYRPADSIYKNENCNGIELSLSNRESLRPVSFGLMLISLLAQLYPEQVAERLYKTHANPSGSGHLDKLTGVKDSFKKILAGNTFDTDVADIWEARVKPFLLY